jgi:hypothetical protein
MRLYLKANIPVYEGRIQPDEFIDWLNTVERVFEYQDVLEEEKVKIVAIKLKKHASIWWEQLKMKRAREGKQKNQNLGKNGERVAEEISAGRVLTRGLSSTSWFCSR